MSCLEIVFAAKVASGALRGYAEGKPRWLGEQEVRLKIGAFGQKVLDDYFMLEVSRREPDLPGAFEREVGRSGSLSDWLAEEQQHAPL